MFWQIALLAGQMILGEVTRQRPKRTSFQEFIDNNEPSEVRPIVYAGGTIELTPTRQWYGDYKQRAVERDSHWTDYLFLGGLAFLLDAITVSYRSYIGEMFPLCYGPDTHVERITIDDRLMFQATVGSDNAGGGFLIDDPQAWGGDQPPGQGGEYAFCHLTRGNYTDGTDAYLESLLTTPPNKTPSLRGISTLVKLGPSSDVPESGYFHAGGNGDIPKFKLWKVTVRRQPDSLATGFNKVGRHMNPMEVIYEWSTSLEYGAKVPLDELNIPNLQQLAEDLHAEGSGWSGRIENATSPRAVIEDVMAQFDIVDNNSPSLGLGFRLIRRDYSFGSLRVLNRDNVTRVERFTPGTYEDTKNITRVEYPDQNNNFELRPAIYSDPANLLIQGRAVPETKSFLGVADAEQANIIATRDGRAISLPKAPLECFVFPSFGRLTYRGEVVLFEWSSPSFSMVMRVLAITPNGPDEADYRLVLIEDQFSTGLRTFGEPVGTLHDDPGEGLETAPPSAAWDTVEIPTTGLRLTLTLTNTNQFVPTIEGAITFGSYAPGGQYARLYVTEPGGVQTLSPARLLPDADNDARFLWPADAVGEYEFCVQTFSTFRDATNGVKVCAEIDVANIGSPSLSPSASVSPSASPSVSPSSSVSPSNSPSPSRSQSPSSSVSLSTSPSSSVSPSASTSPSVSPSPSASVSPSASQSPSSSASPSSGGVFDPTTIQGANCRLWLPPHSLSLSDNDPVGTFPNLGVPGGNFTESGSARPTFKTNIKNGYPALRYDGSDDRLVGNGASNYVSAGAYTYCVIVKPSNTGGTNTGANAWSNPAIVDGGGWQGVVVTNSQYHGYIFSDGDAGGAGSGYTPGDWAIVIVTWNGTNLSIRVNGGSAITDAASNPDNLSANLATGQGGSGKFNGDMLDIVSWDVALNSSEEDTVFAGFNDQYSIF